MELLPAILQSFTLSPSKADTSLRWIVKASPKRVVSMPALEVVMTVPHTQFGTGTNPINSYPFKAMF